MHNVQTCVLEVWYSYLVLDCCQCVQ